MSQKPWWRSVLGAAAVVLGMLFCALGTPHGAFPAALEFAGPALWLVGGSLACSGVGALLTREEWCVRDNCLEIRISILGVAHTRRYLGADLDVTRETAGTQTLGRGLAQWTVRLVRKGRSTTLFRSCLRCEALSLAEYLQARTGWPLRA